MKFLILFSGKIRKKYFKMSSVENFTQSAKRLENIGRGNCLENEQWDNDTHYSL